MIEVKHLVPSVYFDKSRDFQFLAHLYEIVFNHIKTNTDSIYELPFSKNSDKQLIDLVAYTLGFKPRHKYNTEELVSICYILSFLLKNKGNKKSLEWTVKNLYKMEGLTFDDKDSVIVNESMEFIPTSDGVTFVEAKVINLYVGKLRNITLLQDILDYILPASTLYRIIGMGLKEAQTIPDEPYSRYDDMVVNLRRNAQAVAPAIPAESTALGAIDNSWVARAEPLNIESDIQEYPEPEEGE